MSEVTKSAGFGCERRITLKTPMGGLILAYMQNFTQRGDEKIRRIKLRTLL
jgi:hypothetical protein